MKVAYVIIALVFGLDALWWRLADRRLRPLKHARVWRVLLAVFVIGQIQLLISRLIPPDWSRRINGHVPMALIAGQFLWHLAVLPLSLLGGYLGTLLLAKWRKRSAAQGGQDVPPSESAISRRDLIRASAMAVPPLILAGATGISLGQLGHYRVRSLDLKIPGLPRKLDGVVIAHLSDFHAGQFMTREHMRPIIDTANAMSPDLVLITGDLIDYALVDLPPALDALRRLTPKYGLKDGLAMCMGNHDVIENRFTFKRDTDAAGFPVLANSYRTLEVNGCPVQLMAIDWCQGDLRTGEKSAVQMTAAVRQMARLRDPDAFPILLAHHPHAFDAAAAAGLPLTLAGHTHGGQIMATDKIGAGPLLFKYWSGVYRKPNGSQLVVSNGIGNWFPLRVNAPAEVLKLTLRSV